MGQPLHPFQRAILLLLALTGNWGRPGNGTAWWNVTHGDSMQIGAAKPTAGPEGAEAVLQLVEMLEASLKAQDPTMQRTFDEFVEEALAAGWWDGVQRPDPTTPPRVLVECGGNILRRTRGGASTLLEHLWPQLDLIVTIDFRLPATA